MKKLAVLMLGVFAASSVIAEELKPLSIFGDQNTDEIAGSADYIGDDRIKTSGYTDIERLLNEVPGVFSQTEDGLGLRTNIGMRGAKALRTQKVNITEDGILQGPAIYANPSMYFFPDVGRAEGIEVLKGAAAIGTGPRTTSGAINIISRSIPTSPKGYYNVTFGDERYNKQHIHYGGTFGPISYVAEFSDVGYDGHKDLENANGDETGFRKSSDLIKIRYSLPNSYLELSSQNTTEVSHESYVGLTRADFAANPYKRYAASAADKMNNDYHRYILTYNYEMSPTTTFIGKLYKTKYSRQWDKIGTINVNQGDGAGSTVKAISLDSIDWSTDCAANAHSGYEARACDIMTNASGMVAGENLKRSNGHRDYGMYGYQLQLEKEMGNHDITISYRSHHDYRQREDNGKADYWVLDSDNVLTRNAHTDAVGPGERKSAWAESFSIQDRITHGNFVTTLGLRHEDVDYDKLGKYNTGSSAGTPTKTSASDTMIAVSSLYNMGNGKSVFAAYSQGYTPGGPGSDPEESDNIEIGYRNIGPNSSFEVVGFIVDYDKMLETCSIASGCGDAGNNNKNAGEASSEGVEIMYRVNNLFPSPAMKGAESVQGIKYPLKVAATFQKSEWDVPLSSSVSSGNDIEYTPENIIYVSLGAVTSQWDMQIGAKYNDKYFTNNANTAETEDAWILDFQGGMNLNAMGMPARAYLNVDNLLDKTYLASAHEYGVRANKPQTIMAGISFDF